MKVTRRTGSLVIVLVIFAAIVLGTALAAIAIDKSEIPMLQQHAAEAAVTADGYTHGSNIGTSPSGISISVNNASDFVTALTVNNSINLQKDIELSSDQVKKICNTEYGGTLYGNGHTITVSFPSTGNAASVQITPNTTSAYGGLVGKLTGKICDLKFVHTGGQLNVQSSAGYSGFAGGLVGSVEGGTIENVRVELSYKNSGRVGFVKGTATDGKYVAAGAMAGRILSGTIKNVTVVNNAWIEAGVWASNNGANSTTVTDQNDSFVGNVAGIIGIVQDDAAWSGSVTMDNIIVEGHDTVNDATLKGRYATNLGTTPISSVKTITVTNFYNKFRNKFSAYTNGSSTTFATAGTNNSLNITNLYKSANATSVSSSANIPGNNTVTIPNDADYSIYFDPKATETSKSLVVVKSGVTGGANYRATIIGASNNSYSDGHYAFNSDGNTVVFRNLPTAASNWSRDGTFTCTIKITQDQIEVPTMDSLNKWEHGYVADDTTTSGTAAISTGTQFEKIFRPNGSLNQSGTYYLTDDIAITGFTGKTFGGTLDGNGHTIFITDTHTGMTGPHIGGLVGTLSGTIKNVRVVLMLPNNTQVTCTNGKGGDDFVIGFGGVVGKINGGTVENVNVVIPSGYTFSAGWSGSGSDVGVGGIAGSMIGSGTVTNCTVQVDGDIRASSGWPFASGIVGATGKEQNYSDFPFRFTNIILKGIGTIGGTTGSGNDTQPTFAAAITITPPITGNTISIDGFIYNMTGENGPTWGSGGGAGSGYGKVSSWGYVCQNNDNGRPTAGVGLSADGKISYSNIYDMGSLMYDTVAENGFTSGGDLIWYDTTNHDGNVYYNMTRTAEIKSTVADSTIPVTPYFPASSNGNLVLVAGDGTVTVPDLRYTNNAGNAFNSTADGSYKVVTVAKGNINTATVTLEEPVAVIVTVDPMNQWEHGYVSDDNTTTSGTAIGSAEVFEKYFSPSGNGSLSNGTYYLTGDITIRGFTGKTFSGTLDGNGHTIYIAATNTGMTGKPIGGLVGELTGKIKNVRVVIGNNVTVGTTAADGSGSYPMIGGIVGYLNGGTLENVQVVVPKDITFATQQFSSNTAFGGMVGEMNNATLTKVTAVIDGTLAPYGSYVWAAVLVGKQAQNGTASTLTDVIVRGQGTFNATSSNSGGIHEDAFLAAVTVFQEASNRELATVNGVIIDFTPTLNACDCYGIFTNNNYGGGANADYSNIINASNIYVINQTANENTSGNKAIDESAVTKSIAATVQDRNDIPVTPYFPISYNEGGTVNTDNLVLVAGNGTDSFTTPVAYNNGTDSFVSEAVTVGSAEYQVVTVAKANVTTKSVSLEIAEVNDPVIATPLEDLVYNGQNGIDVTIGALQCGSYVPVRLELGKDYSITIAAVAGGSVVDNKPVNAGDYTLTVTLTKHIFADGSTEKLLNFTVEKAKLTKPTANGNTFTYTGKEQTYTPDGFDAATMTISSNVQTNAGNYTVTVSVKYKYNYVWADDTDTDITFTFVIGKADQSVNVSIADWTYSGQAKEPDIDGIKENAVTTVTYSGTTNAGEEYDSTTAPTAAGTYTVTVSWKETTNYTAGSVESAEFTIEKAKLTKPTANGNTFTYTGAEQTYIPEDFNAATMTIAGNVQTNAGNYTVTVSVRNKYNYVWADDTATDIKFTFVIAKAAISVTVKIDGWTYGGTPDDPEITGNSGNGAVTYSYTRDDGYYSDSRPVNAGNYKLTAKVAETDNYLSGVAECAFTITKATGFAKISVNGTPYTEKVTAYYTGSAQTFEVTVEGHGGKIYIDDTPSSTMDYYLTNVETKKVEVTVAETPNYTGVTATTVEIEILPAVIESVTLGTTKFAFGTLNTENANDAATYGTAGVTFVNGSGSPKFTYSLAYSKTENGNDKKAYIVVGKYNLNLTLTDGNFVFDGDTSTTAVTVQVTQGVNTWISEDKIANYPFGFEGKPVTGKAKFGTAAVTYYRGDVKGQANKGDAIIFNFDQMKQDAGTYTAVVSVAANDNNYDEISYEYTFVVKKHLLNITNLRFPPETGVSGSAADGFTVTYAPDMRLSATVTVGSAEGYAGNYSDLLGKQDTRTYLFEYSVAGSNVWTGGLPESAGKYTVRFKGMELEEGKDINNFAFVYEGNATELTTKLTINKATVSASAELNGDIVYGMTVAKIKELVSVSEGVSMKDVAVTYINESGESVGYSETTQSGTKLTITITVEAEDDNYTVDSDTVKLEKTVQKAKLTVTAEGGSAHSATFVPDNFKAFDRVEAKWGENPVEASEYPKYLFIELTGYSGEVAGDPETNFGNGEIGVYTFTVKLTDEAAKNFLMVDAAGAEYEGELTFTYTLATEKVTLTVKLEGWTYGDAPNDPTFTVKDADGNSIGMQTIGHYISVKYEGINGTEYDFATAPTEAGDYIITAAITGHTDYVAEEEATKEFTIGKRPIALVLSSDSASEYYDRRVAITDFTSVFGEYFVADDNSYAYEHALKDVFTLTASSDSGDVTEIKNAGSYKITAKLINDNYVWATDATSPEFIYKIDKAIVTIQMAYKEANIYDGEPVDAPVLSLLELPNGEKYGTKDQFTDVKALIKDDEELMAILRAITVKYGIGETPIDAGEYTFNANYPENDNYKAAEYQGLFTIGKAYIGEFSIKVPSHSYTGEILAGQTPVLTGENAQLANEGLSETVSYFVWNGTEYESVETATNVGQYKIVRTSPESNNYHEATAECEFTISPATVTINDYTASYDFGFIAAELKDEYPYVIALTASVSADSADKITYSTELIGDYGSEQGYLNVGSYTLKIVLTNGNYAFTEGAGEIAIEIVPSENKFVSVTKRDRWIYGNKPADINVSVAYGSANIVTYDSEGNVVELSAATYAGSYYDVVTVPASEFGNYAAIEYAGDTSFVIGKATFKWSWKFLPDNIVYGDSLDGAFVINEPEVTGGIESDFVYFVYNTNAVYSVGGDVYSYDPQTDAGTVVTISAQCVWSDETPEGIKTSYVIDPDEFGAIAFNMEVQKKPIAVTAVSLSDIYGSAFDPTGDANEYFGGAFLYNGAPITNLTAQNSVVVIEISGSGLADDRLNAGNYTVTVSVGGNHYIESAEDGTLENGCVSVGYTVMPKTLNISDGIKSLSYEFGMLSPEDLNASDAILNFIGGANGLFDGLAFGDSLTAGDFTLSAAQDYSAFVSEGYMIVSAEPYIVNVALSATSGNYIAPETGLDDIGIYVVKAANRIYGYSVPGWTYLDVRSEYIPAFSAAAFGTVVGSFFDENGTEIAVDDFGATTPAGTYTFRLSVADSDNYSGATRTGSFVVGKRIVVAELTATDVTYDGAVYDGISYTLSFDVSDYIGTVGYEYSENGSAFRKGLPTDAGNYSVRIGEYSDSENIELRAETVDFQINPAPMHFTVTGVDGASVEYGTAIDDIDVNALIVSVVPDSYVGGFEFTVSLITASGTAYRPGLYAGTVLYATVNITLNSNNYYPVVDTAIEMLPKVNITKVSHDMAFEVNDEIITDGSSAAVIEGSANTVIDAISYYMSVNGVQYYEYHITVDGEEYSRNFNWAPGTHTVEVRLSGNHAGSTQFTVVIEEDPDAVDRAPFIPKTVVGEVLESINFTWASAVSIAFGVAVAVLIILFFGLRRAKRK